MLKKVVAIGPESTGKSTLCEQLARHYQTLWCPEYAREYLLIHGTTYTYDDLLTIARGQAELEDRHVARARGKAVLFIDTNMYVMKVWCEFVYGKCHPFILDQIAERDYDLYLLCNLDLPWVADELREYPELIIRQQLFDIYKAELAMQPRPWIEIAGNKEERFHSAQRAVDQLLN